MLKKSLNTSWQMKDPKDNQWLSARVPCSVLSVFLEHNRIKDPYYKDNEYEIRELFREDYEFQSVFSVDKEMLEEQYVDLVCYGLDTLSEITINGQLVTKTNNMHRTWIIPCKEYLHTGENQLHITFRAPITFIENYIPEEGKEIHIVPAGGMRGNQYLRKAHSMFGWDWGAQLPDAGIWRDIELQAYSDAIIEEAEILQHHTNEQVTLEVHTKVNIFRDKEYILQYTLTDPAGNETIISRMAGNATEACMISVEHPQLWWPNGYGKQPLYTLTVQLLHKEKLLSAKEYRLGLRTLTVSQEKDEWGNEFAFMVNGIKIFTKGANYIPEDCIYPRITRERIKRLISDSVKANYNCLRVWGGGYYPSDDFYDLCDEAGIIVWQDLMFACNAYDVTPEFADNIVAEAIDNVKRLRHHASLGLWCGNNEIESAWEGWGDFQKESPKLKADYIIQFEYLLPNAVKECDKQTFYWPSSPSTTGCFDNTSDENRGDVHYWAVWHGLLPFMDFENHFFRFCSEFGFQSFPSIKTINTFAEEEDKNIFSKVMESHQKNNAANGKILYYLSETFRYPNSFENLIYTSQLLQGLAIKTGVEHWRRSRGRCMGSLYWQLNDNWPVNSWASIDYYGRWKALHYMARNFYAPIAGSLRRKGTEIAAWVQNETLTDSLCKVTMNLKSMDFKLLNSVSAEVNIPALGTGEILLKDYETLIRGIEDTVFLEAVFVDQEGQERTEAVVFTPYKHLRLEEPNLMYEINEQEDCYEISIKADKMAAFVEVDLKDCDGIFSDNYFHITAKEPKQIILNKDEIFNGDITSLVDIENKICLRSLRNTY